MSLSPESRLSPRERSEAVKQFYDRFTTNELAKYLFKYASAIPTIEDDLERRRISDYLILLQRVAYAKGISDEEIKIMLNEQIQPYSLAKLRKRKVVNLADFQKRKQLRERRLSHVLAPDVRHTPIPSNLRFLDAARAKKK